MLEIRGDSGGQGRYKEQNSPVPQKCASSNGKVFINLFIMLYDTKNLQKRETQSTAQNQAKVSSGCWISLLSF